MSKKILLVEDEATLAMNEARMLQKHGFEIIIADSGEKAIEKVKSTPHISLILMDIAFGNGIDGAEAARRILEEYDVPIVFLSSHTEPEVVEKTKGIPSYGYVVKNSGETVLHASVNMALELFEAKADRKQAEEQQKERVKELNCLYKISSLVEEPGISLESILQKTADIVPVSWQYPEIAVCRIILDGKEYRSDGFQITDYLQSSTLHVEGNNVGTVEVYYLEQRPTRDEGPFIKEERQLIDAVAERLGKVIERKQNEEELTKMSEMLQEAEDIADLGTWEWNIREKRLSFSDSWLRIHGSIEKKMSQEQMMNILHPEDREKVEEAMNTAFARGSSKITHRIRKADTGEVRYIQKHLRVSFASDTGKPLCMIGTAQDVTEHTELVESLKESEERFNSLTENLLGIVFRGDLNFKLVYIKGAVEAITGYKEEEFIERDFRWDKLVYQEDENILKDSQFVSKITSEPVYKATREYRIVRKDGQVRWVSETIHNVSDDTGEPRYVEGIILDVTEEKIMEERLQTSERRLQSIFDNMNEGFAISDTEGTIVTANKAAAELVGYETPSQLVGLQERELFAKPSQQDEYLEILLSEGKINNLEIKGKRRDGSFCWWLVNTRLLTTEDGEFSGTEVLARDITERRKQQEELRLLMKAVQTAPLSIIITDRDADITYVNPFFYKITGYSYEEVLGENPRILKSGEHEDQFYKDMWNTLTGGSIWEGEICDKKKNGELYWEHAWINPIYNEVNEITHYLGIKEDITERRELEQLKESVERITRHDLKSPLNGIIGIPQILREAENITEAQKEYLEMIIDSGNKVLRMINLSLALYQIEEGTYEHTAAFFDILKLIQEIIQEEELFLKGKNVSIHIDTSEYETSSPEEIQLYGDDLLTYSILSNLIKNAIEASPAGKSIDIRIKKDEDIQLVIHNRGGVPEKLKDSFFDKYRTYGKKHGTGLGTYSAKLLCEAQGWDIWMESSENEGTSVGIRIPTTHSPRL